MFALHTLEMLNFRSYRGEHSFDFPDRDGLYFFAGTNSVDAIGGNGAGKSTLWEAVTWCLYGRTTRGLKADDIITWGESTCRVSLELTVGDNRYLIKRSQKPNSLTIDDKPVDQEELEKHIRLNFEAFSCSVLNAQFGTSFFAMKPAAKLTLFSDIMRLGFWLDASDRAAKQARELETEIDRWRTVIEQHKAKIELTKADIVDLEAKETNFKAERQRQIDEIKKQSLESWGDTREYATIVENAPRVEAKLLADLKAAKRVLVRYAAYVELVLEKISDNNASKKIYTGNYEAHLSAIKRLERTAGACRECGRLMDEQHKKTELARLDGHLKTSEINIKAAHETHESHLKDLVRQKSKVAKIESEIEEINDEITAHKRKVAQAEAKADAAQAKFDELGERLHAIEGAANPHTEMLQRKRMQLKAYKKIITESTESLNQAEAEHVAVSYWIKGFKQVRLFIIEQAFNALELEVNNSLAQLGMVEWQITFDIERENKAGGITKGFVVFVKGPSNPEPVKWESWSGGETQRLQLAGDLGLANLIMQQAGLRNTIEVFDEPSTHMSAEGLVDLANLLHERALNDGKRIWIVDHTAITNFGDFEAIIKVRKDKHGSRIDCA